jgi:peptide/nickel transport system ATP-binding protein
VDVPLMPIPGSPPSLLNPPSGCPFHTRCAFTGEVGGDRCVTERPTLPDGRGAACHLTPDQKRDIFIEQVQPRLR